MFSTPPPSESQGEGGIKPSRSGPRPGYSASQRLVDARWLSRFNPSHRSSTRHAFNEGGTRKSVEESFSAAAAPNRDVLDAFRFVFHRVSTCTGARWAATDVTRSPPPSTPSCARRASASETKPSGRSARSRSATRAEPRSSRRSGAREAPRRLSPCSR